MSPLLRQLPVALLALCCGGCLLFARDIHSETGPPEDSPAKAAQWWDDYVAKDRESSLGLLAVLLEASDTHRHNGSAATYQSYYVGQTQLHRYHFECHFPLPMPDHAAAALRERLSRCPPDPDQAFYGSLRLFWVRDARGCTKEEAQAIWENAAKKIAAKVDRPIPRPTLGPPSPAAP
jgi:hypothetical protein